jgi:hypothetical protein
MRLSESWPDPWRRNRRKDVRIPISGGAVRVQEDVVDVVGLDVAAEFDGQPEVERLISFFLFFFFERLIF